MSLSQRQLRLAPFFLVAAIAIFSLGLKLNSIHVGAPYITIDDQTMYEGGFLVWFGHAPPQRMYLESWLAGASSIATYAVRTLATGGDLGINLIADAYRDFYNNPDPYVTSYRSLSLLMDMLTALIVFLLARQVFRIRPHRDWLAAASAGLYLLSFNTLWCYIVARPDTPAVLFAALGLYLYYRSDFGEKRTSFLLSAGAFGLATGMKLHGAFFVVFICLDMWRMFGLRQAIARLFPYGCIAIFVFAVAAGSVLFDPALYVKLRALNARDDASPWLQWGDQFITILRGTGWLIVPLVLGAAWYARRSGQWKLNPQITSIIFLTICWLILFSSIRVMRAYWMLPALPLFYITAIYGLSELKNWRLTTGVYVLLVGVMGWQLVGQMNQLRAAPYDELRNWISQNVQPQEPFYLLGYMAANLPRNTTAILNQKEGIERMLSEPIASGESFTERHIRLWEERSHLKLLDMLNFRSEIGFNYYGYYVSSPTVFENIVPFDSLEYVFLQDHFSLTDEPEIAAKLQSDFTVVATVVGPGGGGKGLSYSVYQRK